MNSKNATNLTSLEIIKQKTERKANGVVIKQKP